MAKKPKLITLCMIVKNEAADLPRCLRSVKGVADQIVVVDTGSTDGTVEIARKFGASVVRSEWKGDFAEARNAGLAHAEGEWILFLDADEELDAGTRGQLREFALHREITGFFVNVWNYSGDGGDGATINPVLRMFRNDRRYRFEGRIHEQIAAPITRHTPEARFHLSDVIVHHYGYRREVVAAKDKLRRNRTLLEQAIAEEPENRFHWYNLGVEYFRAGEVESALRAFRQAREGIDFASISYAHLLVKHETSCLQVLRRWEEALQTAVEGLVWYGEYPDLWHAKGVSLAAMGLKRQAAEAFAAALAIGKAPALYHTEDGMGTYQSAYWLGLMHEAELDFETAAHWYAEAVRYKGSLLAPLVRLCRMMKVAAPPERLAEFASSRFTLESPQAAVKLAAIMLDCGCYEALAIWLEKWLVRAGDGERATLQPWLDLAGAGARLSAGMAKGREAGGGAALGTAEQPAGAGNAAALGAAEQPAGVGNVAASGEGSQPTGADYVATSGEATQPTGAENLALNAGAAVTADPLPALSAAESRLSALTQAQRWLAAEQDAAYPPAAWEWLPLLLAGGGSDAVAGNGMGGSALTAQRVRGVIGELLDSRPAEDAAETALSREGVRAGAKALVALADQHLAAVQQTAGRALAVQSVRLALPGFGGG